MEAPRLAFSLAGAMTIPEGGSREAQGWGSEGDTGAGASFSDSIQVLMEHKSRFISSKQFRVVKSEDFVGKVHPCKIQCVQNKLLDRFKC